MKIRNYIFCITVGSDETQLTNCGKRKSNGSVGGTGFHRALLGDGASFNQVREKSCSWDSKVNDFRTNVKGDLNLICIDTMGLPNQQFQPRRARARCYTGYGHTRGVFGLGRVCIAFSYLFFFFLILSKDSLEHVSNVGLIF